MTQMARCEDCDQMINVTKAGRFYVHDTYPTRLVDPCDGSRQMVSTLDAVAKLECLDASDPEKAHGEADDVLLANVPPEVRAAYQRLVERCEWWACA